MSRKKSRSDRHERDAREVADCLRRDGHIAQAEAVLAVCRSLSSMRETASRLHSDSMAQPRQIEAADSRALWAALHDGVPHA